MCHGDISSVRARQVAAGIFNVINASLIRRLALHLKRVAMSERESDGGGELLMMNTREWNIIYESLCDSTSLLIQTSALPMEWHFLFACCLDILIITGFWDISFGATATSHRLDQHVDVVRCHIVCLFLKHTEVLKLTQTSKRKIPCQLRNVNVTIRKHSWRYKPSAPKIKLSCNSEIT